MMIKGILSRRENAVGIGLSLLALAVYLVFPTRNYYWDGISFALQIEKANGLEPMLFNPNHLGYDTTWYALFHALRTFIPDIRALTVLVRANQVLGAISAWLIFQILGRYTRDSYSRMCLTLIFVFSATWWKFSTDANAYVPGTFCLIAAFHVLTRSDRKPNMIAVGILHAMAMLFHQIAIFFYIPAITTIFLGTHWKSLNEKTRSALTYSMTAACAVALPYVLVWTRIVNRGGEKPWIGGFLTWITSNGHEEYIFRSVPYSLVKTLQSSVRLFFGGRISLARDFVETPILATLGFLLAACGVFFVVHLLRNIRRPRESELWQDPTRSRRSAAWICISWMAPFLAFLLFWLTEWPYYRLFYLPAFIGLVALLVERQRRTSGPSRSYALAGFAALMTLSNFIFLIYPFSKSDATPPVHLAMGASSVWNENSVVFYREFSVDNRMFQYFNRQTRWETLNSDVSQFKNDLCSLNGSGYETWIDLSGLNYLASFQDAETWLEGVELYDNPNLVNSKHEIHFVQLVPSCEERASIN